MCLVLLVEHMGLSWPLSRYLCILRHIMKKKGSRTRLRQLKLSQNPPLHKNKDQIPRLVNFPFSHGSAHDGSMMPKASILLQISRQLCANQSCDIVSNFEDSR
mmetsp:Transcript_16047/g.19288  ORF Transcript_16047/g.19288 Transcript_16047/m.19288 type:complete len:103 (-) Transcript_16047:54-362(-)